LSQKRDRGSLDKILREVDYTRIFPDAQDKLEARRKVREIYPEDEEFMAFELV
jgi:hypothetical protein